MPYLLCIFLFLSACATIDHPAKDINGPVSKVFSANYEQAWRATMLVLEKYSIKEEDKQKGFIKTALIRGEHIWNSPFDHKTIPGLRYSLLISLIKGRQQGKQVVQIRILKKIFAQKGFMEEARSIPSDGLEEKVLLYRILREINISYIMKRYQQSAYR